MFTVAPSNIFLNQNNPRLNKRLLFFLFPPSLSVSTVPFFIRKQKESNSHTQNQHNFLSQKGSGKSFNPKQKLEPKKKYRSRSNPIWPHAQSLNKLNQKHAPMSLKTFLIYRWNPENPTKLKLQNYQIDLRDFG